MLLSLLYGFFNSPSIKLVQRLKRGFTKTSITVSEPSINLNARLTSATVDVSLTDVKIVQKYPYMRVEID